MPIALLRRSWGGFVKARVRAVRIAPPQQGWQELQFGGSSPIVDDESCDFLCR
jgi:hypothetical protein